MTPAIFEGEFGIRMVDDGQQFSEEVSGKRITILPLTNKPGFIAKDITAGSRPVIVCPENPGPVPLGPGILEYVPPSPEKP